MAVGTAISARTARALFPLEAGATYLNHGTVGVTPWPVLRRRAALLEEIERHPARFMLRELMRLDASTSANALPGTLHLRAAAARVAAFVGASADDLVFVDNATAGVNAVLRSIDLEPNSEILVHDHAYGGVARATARIASERGWTVRPLVLPGPDADDAAYVAAVERAVGPRTRLALLDHVSSETALVMPLAAMAAACRARGVAMLVDGAHGPGAVELDLGALDVDWYVANLHKWAFVPRSCGILWAAPSRRARLQPAVLSWASSGDDWIGAFEWPGTRDPTPWLSAPAALDFIDDALGGARALREHNHGLAWRSARFLAERWNVPFSTPESRVGAMVCVPLPSPFDGGAADDAQRLRDRLFVEHRIEAPVLARDGRLHVRVSLQVYNDDADVERLAAAVESLARSS
jgi:isopenicillin-N epimerase